MQVQVAILASCTAYVIAHAYAATSVEIQKRAAAGEYRCEWHSLKSSRITLLLTCFHDVFCSSLEPFSNSRSFTFML